jgi:outer membrane protein assembly factor BamB
VGRRRFSRAVALIAVAVGAAVLPACTVEWHQRLFDSAHGSSTSDPNLTADEVGQLTMKWRFYSPTNCPSSGGNGIWATPVTFKGVIYVGTDRGCLYAIDEATGQVKWGRFFAYVLKTTCEVSLGIVSSVVVADDGQGNPVLYFHSPDGYLYKLRGSDGSTIWRSVVKVASNTVNDVFGWSSPTVANGKVIVGVASNCDVPFTQGEVRAYDTANGALLWAHKTIPDRCPRPVPPEQTHMCPNLGDTNGCVGAGDWYDAAVDGAGDVYVTTGSTCDFIACDPTTSNQNPGFEQYSILKLDGDTGALIWKAPAPACTGDPDYASSPVLFEGNGVPLVGATNKDGWFRVYRRDNGQPVWEALIGRSTTTSGPFAGGVWDGQRLFVAGTATTVGNWTRNAVTCDAGFPSCWTTRNGTAAAGSIRGFDPATGNLVTVEGQPFELALPVGIMGPCAMNANKLLACGGADIDGPPGHINGTYIVDTTKAPAVLRRLEDTNNTWSFAQPVFENGAILSTYLGAMLKWGV